MSRRKEKHHVVPRSRGGSNLEYNIALVPSEDHRKYHMLFSNRTPVEILDYLVRDFWNGDRRFLFDYLGNNRVT